MRQRIAEVAKRSIAHIFRDAAVEASNGGVASLLKAPDDLPQVLRIHAPGELGRACEVAEHQCQLPPLGSDVLDIRFLRNRLGR